MNARAFGRTAAIALLAAVPVTAGSGVVLAAPSDAGALTADRTEAHTGERVTLTGADCLTTAAESPAEVSITAVDQYGNDLLGEPSIQAPAPDGSWSWWFDAPAGTGTFTVLASCVNYTGTEDYQPLDVEILGQPASANGQMSVDRMVITKGENITVSGTGCVLIDFESTEVTDPLQRAGVWVMASGQIDPTFVTPAADGTWTWTTSTQNYDPATRTTGSTVTVSAFCHRGGGDEYDYADVTLPFRLAAPATTVTPSPTVTSTPTGKVGDTRRLSDTGVDAATVGLGGLALLALGGAVVLIGRRRASDHA